MGSLKQSLDTTDWQYKQHRFKGINNEAETREYLLGTSIEANASDANRTIFFFFFLSASKLTPETRSYSPPAWYHEPLKELRDSGPVCQTVCRTGRNPNTPSDVGRSKHTSSLPLPICLGVPSRRR